MATNNGTTFRTDFVADDSKFSNVLNRVKGKTKEYGGEVKKTGAATAGSTKKQEAHGRAVLEVSRAYDDLQYGIRGVLNNIPGILQGIGATAKMTGVLTIAIITAESLWRKFGKSSKDAAGDVDKWKDVSSRFKGYAETIKTAIDSMAKSWDGYQEHLEDSATAADKLSKIRGEQISLQLREMELAIEQKRLSGELTDDAARKLKLDIESAKAAHESAEAAKEAAKAIQNQEKKTEARREDLAGAASRESQIKSEVEQLRYTRSQSRLRAERRPLDLSVKKTLKADEKALELKTVELEQAKKARLAAQEKLDEEERTLKALKVGNRQIEDNRKKSIELGIMENQAAKDDIDKKAAEKELEEEQREFLSTGKTDKIKLRQPQSVRGYSMDNGRNPADYLAPAGLSSRSSLVDSAAPRQQFRGLDKLAELQKQTQEIQTKSLDRLTEITKAL